MPEYDRFKNISKIAARFENSCQDVFLSRDLERQCLVFSFTAENFQKNKTERSIVEEYPQWWQPFLKNNKYFCITICEGHADMGRGGTERASDF